LGVQHEVSYDAPLLKLSLKDRDGHPIESAKVTAKMIRPVQAGYDFELILTPIDSGVYAAELHAPLSGVWTAKMEAQWDGQSYRTTYRFVTK
jgi:nitrogen fixation protein FixH